jgi:hypothetical protein
MQLVQDAPFTDMLNVRTLVMKKPEVIYANIQEGTNTISTTGSETSQTTYISVQAFLANDDITNETIARDIANTVISNYSSSNSKDIIQVTMVYGYDIGIWSFWRNHNHKYAPHDLN